MGRRMPDEDRRQIKRWKAIRRHVRQVEKNCEPGDLTCRPRQRQALLHWAYDSRKILTPLHAVPFAARAHTNVGTKATLATVPFWCGFALYVPTNGSRHSDRNVATLGLNLRVADDLRPHVQLGLDPRRGILGVVPTGAKPSASNFC